MIFVRHGRAIAQSDLPPGEWPLDSGHTDDIATLRPYGTVMSLYLASVVPTLNAMRFWTELRNPDAWEIDGASLTRLPATAAPGDPRAK